VETLSKWKQSIMTKKAQLSLVSLGLTQLQRQPRRACNYPSAGLYRWGCGYSCL